MANIISDFIEYPDKIRYRNIKNKFDNRKFFITSTNNEIEGFRIKDNPEIAERDLNRLKNSILLQARYFDESTFKIHLYKLKHNLIESLFDGKPVYLNDFFTLDLFLAAINNKKWDGRDKQIKKINGLVNKFFKRVEEINFLEDTMNRLYLVTGNHVLRMEYLENFMEQYNNYGLISHKDDPNKAFQFEEIDNLKNFGKKFTQGCDLLEVLKSYFRFMISLSNLFNIRENSSKFYNLELDNVDIAYLLSLFFSYGADNFIKVPENRLHDHFIKNYGDEYKDYREFIKKVCKEDSKFPIFVYIGGFYYISKHNLLLYIVGNLFNLPKWFYSRCKNGSIKGF